VGAFGPLSPHTFSFFREISHVKLITLFSIAALLAACGPAPDAVSSAPAAPASAEPMAARAVSAVDSIAFVVGQQNIVTNAPDSCRNGSYTGCPTIRYGDFIEGYAGGAFVGYVSGVKCTSSNTAVATLNAKCYATVIGPGQTTITVSYDKGRLTASSTITAN
jgi:hypothetical protein